MHQSNLFGERMPSSRKSLTRDNGKSTLGLHLGDRADQAPRVSAVSRLQLLPAGHPRGGCGWDAGQDALREPVARPGQGVCRARIWRRTSGAGHPFATLRASSERANDELRVAACHWRRVSSCGAEILCCPLMASCPTRVPDLGAPSGSAIGERKTRSSRPQRDRLLRLGTLFG